jgi:AcrR family transcriptional regulator
MEIETMRATPPTVRPPPSELDTPVKDRIIKQATRLFIHAGVNVSLESIAHLAHTNVATIIKLFGTQERLVSDFVGSLIKEAERSWKEIEQEHPDDPEAQLRKWVYYAEFAADLSMQDPQAQLSRAAVDLISIISKNPMLTDIETLWQAERRRIVKLCEQARVRDPSGLADKLLLLVNGARNERNRYGYKGPSSKLSEAGDDLMVAHGALRKPLLELD